MVKRNAQMGTVTFLFLFSLTFSLVAYLAFGDVPLFFALAGCIGANPNISCQSFSNYLGSNLLAIAGATLAALGVIFAVTTATGGISLTPTQFPNPYAYFAPIAGALAAVMVTIPSGLFSGSYGLPWAMNSFLIAAFTFVESMAIISWLKGGAQA